jgi:hypothetical protein
MENEPQEIETSTPTFRELQDQLMQVTRDKQALEERIEYSAKRREAQEARVNHERQLAEYRNLHRERALNSALNHYAHDLPQFDASHPDVAKLAQGALRVAKITGYLSDAETAVENLPDEVTQWSEIRNDISLVFGDEAEKQEKIREIVRDTLRSLEYHPTDPRFLEVWKSVTITATRNHLCAEFDKLAGMFGIPTDMEFDYEGYIEQSGSFYNRQFISGTTTRADIENGDIADDVDISNADYEIEETNNDLSYS